MPRILLSSIAVIVFVTSGCGKSPSPPPPKNESVTTIAEPSPSPAPLPTAVPTKPVVQPPANTLAPVASPYRDFAARYLDSDGQGGWRTNEKAATDLEKLGPDERAQLWPLLKDSQVEVRRGAAVYLLSQLEPSNSEHVAAFSSLLDDSDRMVRARALDAARQFSHADQIALLPRLTPMLDPQREDRPENRAATARLCASLKKDAAPSLPGLQAAATNDSDPKVRATALAAIAQISDPQASVAHLAKGLADKDAAVRVVAAARLRQLGPTAAPATKDLAQALADSSPDVAQAAADSLIRIGPPAVQPLAAQLSSKSATVRKLALSSLARLGPAAKPASSQIEKCKQDSDPQVRQLADELLKILAGQ
jgi:HEAT repeat protein